MGAIVQRGRHVELGSAHARHGPRPPPHYVSSHRISSYLIFYRRPKCLWRPLEVGTDRRYLIVGPALYCYYYYYYYYQYHYYYYCCCCYCYYC